MNHDYAHCMDYDSTCPMSCFRARLIDDLLVKNRILKDDNSTIVIHHDGSRVKYDKDNPRVEIEITKEET